MTDTFWRVRIVVDGALLHFASRTEPRVEIPERTNRIEAIEGDWITDGVDVDVVGFIDFAAVTAVSWRLARSKEAQRAEHERRRAERYERVATAIEAYVRGHGGCTWSEVAGALHEHVRHEYLAMVRERLLDEGVLVNAGRGQRFALWHRDDPALAGRADDDAERQNGERPDPELVARAVNAASEAARTVVNEYSFGFERREDYEPLEWLAVDVQRAVVKAAAAVLGERQGGDEGE